MPLPRAFTPIWVWINFVTSFALQGGKMHKLLNSHLQWCPISIVDACLLVFVILALSPLLGPLAGYHLANNVILMRSVWVQKLWWRPVWAYGRPGLINPINTWAWTEINFWSMDYHVWKWNVSLLLLWGHCCFSAVGMEAASEW